MVYSTVNVISATELFTLEWLILCYMNITLIKMATTKKSYHLW